MDISRPESFVFEKMAESRLPGLSLALVKNGDVIHTRGFGQRDLKHGLPATPETLYCIGSVTKSFTALAIMQLAERGLLDPADQVERYLPFPFRPKGGTVRLEHLLTHTSGIPVLAYSEALIGHANGTGSPWLPISGPEDVLTFMDGAEHWQESSPANVGPMPTKVTPCLASSSNESKASHTRITCATRFLSPWVWTGRSWPAQMWKQQTTWLFRTYFPMTGRPFPGTTCTGSGARAA